MNDKSNTGHHAFAPNGSSNKRETLKRIVDAAKHEFAAKGLADARIDLIAQAAGVTKQLVYHYFRSKEELFACVLEESSAQTMQDLVALDVDQLPPREALRMLLSRMICPYRDPLLSSLAQEGIRYHAYHATPSNSFIDMAPALNLKMRRVLERGVQSGDFRADVDADLLLAAAVLATTSAFVSRYTVSNLSGLDLADERDADAWHRFSIEFVLSAIERERSTLHPLIRPIEPVTHPESASRVLPRFAPADR